MQQVKIICCSCKREVSAQANLRRLPGQLIPRQLVVAVVAVREVNKVNEELDVLMVAHALHTRGGVLLKAVVIACDQPPSGAEKSYTAPPPPRCSWWSCGLLPWVLGGVVAWWRVRGVAWCSGGDGTMNGGGDDGGAGAVAGAVAGAGGGVHVCGSAGVPQ